MHPGARTHARRGGGGGGGGGRRDSSAMRRLLTDSTYHVRLAHRTPHPQPAPTSESEPVPASSSPLVPRPPRRFAVFQADQLDFKAIRSVPSQTTNRRHHRGRKFHRNDMHGDTAESFQATPFEIERPRPRPLPLSLPPVSLSLEPPTPRHPPPLPNTPSVSARTRSAPARSHPSSSQVRACVRACARARACVPVRAALFREQGKLILKSTGHLEREPGFGTGEWTRR